MTRLTVPPDSLYGMHNMPYGVYSLPGAAPRVAARLGDQVIDLGALLGESGDNAVFAGPALNGFMAQGHDRWGEVR
jgi:fumarylacetoacetase